jgi:TPR repeat protein
MTLGTGLLLCAAILCVAAVQPAVSATGDTPDPLRAQTADTLYDVQVLLNLAEHGDRRAAFLLGTRFASGRGGARDDSEAFRWFEQAAEAGLAEAQYNLGIMYANGRGVQRNVLEAARWYRAAAEQGIAEAQFNIGTLYGLGLGVTRNETLAAEWLHKAADKKLPQAQYNLGILYEHGRGVRLDGRAALVWYQRAADQGYRDAEKRLQVLTEKLNLSQDTGPSAPGRLAASPAPAEPPAKAPVPLVKSRQSSVAIPTPASALAKIDTRAAAGSPASLGRAPEKSTGAAHVADTWIASADPGSYTLQLMSHTSEADVRRFMEGKIAVGSGGYFVHEKAGTVWYTVVYGAYPSYESAIKAAGELPAKFGKIKPWVRKVELVHLSQGTGPSAPGRIAASPGPAEPPAKTPVPPAKTRQSSVAIPTPVPALAEIDTRAGAGQPESLGRAQEESTGAAHVADTWIASVDPGSYTLQLMSHTSEADVRRFMEGKIAVSSGGYFVHEKAETVWYTVVYGAYPSYEFAIKAAGELPAKFGKIKPWVRNVGLIHEQMTR